MPTLSSYGKQLKTQSDPAGQVTNVSTKRF